MMALVSVPLFNAPDLARQSVESIGGVDKYLVCNSNEWSMIQVWEQFGGGYNFNHNANCNPAWNKGMEHFLKGKWDWLVLGSSDVILHKRWATLFDKLQPTNEVYVPNFIESAEQLAYMPEELHPTKTELTGGVMGAYTILPREAVEIIYPIPKQFKLWYGDLYMFTKLRNRGYKVMMLNDWFAYHFISTGVVACPDFTKIIKREKKLWEKLDPEVLK